jgi:hypothetical protein
MHQETVTTHSAVVHQVGIYAWLTGLCILPFLRLGSSLDAHWTSAWPALLLMVVVGLASRLITISHRFFWIMPIILVVMTVQNLTGKEIYGEDVFLLISLLLLVSVQPTVALVNLPAARNGVTALWCVFSLVLISLMVRNSLLLGYSHESTYAIKPLFAHRNIAIETYTLWSVALFALLSESRLRWPVLLIAASVVLVYQVRTAFIGLALFLVIEFVRNFKHQRWLKWFLLAGCALLIALQMTFFFLRTPAQKHHFDALPDLVKQLDLIYNLTSAESSSERIVMWQWTVDRSNLFGNGIGCWKFDAEGYIGAALGKCELMVRHPHSDILKMVFETGVLFTILFLAWWLILLKPSFRYLVVFLPMFVFAFPTERGETLGALMVMLLFTAKPKPVNRGLRLMPGLIVTAALVTVSLGWSRSQHCLGKAMRDPLTLKDTSPLDRKLLDAFPFDIVLNRLPTYQAIILADAGETEAARELLAGVLVKHSNDQGALRLMLRLGGELPSNAVVCDSLTIER